MFRMLCNFVPAAALVALAVSSPGALAQERAATDHPRLRAALHEMRDARRELKASTDDWPPPHRDRAKQALDDAVGSVSAILGVKDVEGFRGVERKADYYRRFKDHPRLRAALESVRDAREESRGAKGDYRGLKDRALDDLDLAAADILILIRNRKPRP